jgi:hypothetical protein
MVYKENIADISILFIKVEFTIQSFSNSQIFSIAFILITINISRNIVSDWLRVSN